MFQKSLDLSFLVHSWQGTRILEIQVLLRNDSTQRNYELSYSKNDLSYPLKVFSLKFKTKNRPSLSILHLFSFFKLSTWFAQRLCASSSSIQIGFPCISPKDPFLIEQGYSRLKLNVEDENPVHCEILFERGTASGLTSSPKGCTAFGKPLGWTREASTLAKGCPSSEPFSPLPRFQFSKSGMYPTHQNIIILKGETQFNELWLICPYEEKDTMLTIFSFQGEMMKKFRWFDIPMLKNKTLLKNGYLHGQYLFQYSFEIRVLKIENIFEEPCDTLTINSTHPLSVFALE